MSAVPAGTDEAVVAAAAAAMTAPHHYYPLGVVLPGYTPNTLTTPTLLAIFGTACVAALVPAYAVLRRAKLSSGEVAAAMWFVLCGCIHLVLEGASFPYPVSHIVPNLSISPLFLLPVAKPFFTPCQNGPSANYFQKPGHFARISVAPSSSVLSQLWKEYALSDSRYLTRDAFVTVMEGITAFCWGPLSFVIAWTIAARHPARHFLQTVVSLGQFYGVVLYYGTCMHDAANRGIEYSRPEAYYYWGYYVLLNAFWVFIPLYLLAQSARTITAALAQVARDERGVALGSPRAAKWKA